MEAVGCDLVHVYDKSEGGLLAAAQVAVSRAEGEGGEGSENAAVPPHAPSSGDSLPRLPPRYRVEAVPNVGRESETYLRHLVENYDALADYTLMLQDDTHVHVPCQQRAAICAQVVAVLQTPGSPGRVLQVVHRGKRLHAPRTIDQSDPLYPKLEAACARFGLGPLPESYQTHVCAFLIVSAASVRRHPRALYEQLLAWHGESASVLVRRGATEAELAPWLLEHLWTIIFDFPPP